MVNESISHVGKGALGGLAGTLFMNGVMAASRRFPASMQPELKGNPAEYIASKLPPSLRPVLIHGGPYLYGTSWPALFGFFAPRLGIDTFGKALVAGAALGAGVWAIGHVGWLPLAKLEDPVHRQKPGAIASGLVSHAIYGMIAALPFALFGRKRRTFGRRAMSYLRHAF